VFAAVALPLPDQDRRPPGVGLTQGWGAIQAESLRPLAVEVKTVEGTEQSHGGPERQVEGFETDGLTGNAGDALEGFPALGSGDEATLGVGGKGDPGALIGGGLVEEFEGEARRGLEGGGWGGGEASEAGQGQDPGEEGPQHGGRKQHTPAGSRQG
jgi:hypothetical protein